MCVCLEGVPVSVQILCYEGMDTIDSESHVISTETHVMAVTQEPFYLFHV